MNTKFDELTHRLVGVALVVMAVSLLGVCAAEAGLFLPTGAMQNARYAHTATLLRDGRVLVAGGYEYGEAEDVAITSAELYHPASGTWEMANPMHTARASHTATLLPNGKVLVAGGYGDTDNAIANAELYDPATGSWVMTSPMHHIHSEHTATLLPSGEVLVASGDDSSAELYDPATGTWAETGSLNMTRWSHTATLMGNGKVLVAGGEGVRSVEIYDPATGIWTWASDLSEERYSHTATLLPDGRTLVVGGLDCCGANGRFALASHERFNPDDGIWTLSQADSVELPFRGRGAHTATLLFNGRVLVTGGLSSALGGLVDLVKAKEYNPATATWLTASNMTVARAHHTATLLANGQVLIAGGNLHDTRSELYEPDPSSFPTSQPTTLIDASTLANGSFQFAFTNTAGAAFNVLATTHPTLPLNDWMVLGSVTEIAPGQFQFADSQATNFAYRFYQLRSQ